MNHRKRVVALLLIMTVVSIMVGGISISLLYRAALQDHRAQLVEVVRSQVRLIEAVNRITADFEHEGVTKILPGMGVGAVPRPSNANRNANPGTSGARSREAPRDDSSSSDAVDDGWGD